MAKISLLMGFLCLATASVINGAPNPTCEAELDLFAAKTPYSEDLGRILPSNNQLFNQFGSLSQEDNKLRLKGCSPLSIYLIGRHGARLPHADEIDTIITGIEQLKTLFVKRSKYTNWSPTFEHNEADLVTDSGIAAERSFAQRLKSVYPEFFDASMAFVSLATTSKLRTAQTGIAFISEVDNFWLGLSPSCSANPRDYNCGPNSSPHEAECFMEILSQYQSGEMEFHKICKANIKAQFGDRAKKAKSKGKTKSEILQRISVIKGERLERIGRKLQRKLGLRETPTSDMITSAFRACHYEAGAIFGSASNSIWCALFDREDHDAMEYLADAVAFYKMASNRESYSIQSMPLFKKLFEEFNLAIQSGIPRAYYGFTHNGVLKKFYTGLGYADPDKDVGYTMRDLEIFRRTGQVPEERLWRTSLMVPFSGNIAFTLYMCPHANYRVLASISEHAVRIKGCKKATCPFDAFFNTFGSIGEYTEQDVYNEVFRSMQS